MWLDRRRIFYIFLCLIADLFIGPYHELGSKVPTLRNRQRSFLLEDRASSVWCRGQNPSERMCIFRNLCYHSGKREFVFFHGSQTSMLGNVEGRHDPALADLSSVRDHPALYFNFIDMPLSALMTFQIKDVSTDTLVMSRFNPDNLMHVFHDDLIPILATFREIRGCTTSDEIFSCLDNATIFFTDTRPKGQYWYLYKALVNNEPVLLTPKASLVYCFNKAIVGLQKQSTWYQYGFNMPQGPLRRNILSAGKEVAIFSKHFRDLLHIKRRTPTEPKYAIVVSRKKNRLILNEQMLVNMIETFMGLRAVVVDVGRVPLPTVIELLLEAELLVAMHGSALVLSMFMRPDSAVLEMFPYGVNPSHYTPYKTLANLPGVDLFYKAWKNEDVKNTVTHPDSEPQFGGILHLPKEEQRRILNSHQVPPHLCCGDPEWLFRIYQDTFVDMSIIPLLVEIKTRKHSSIKVASAAMYPGAVTDIHCTLKPLHQNYRQLLLSWSKPWNTMYISFERCWYELWLQSESGVDTLKIGSQVYSRNTTDTVYQVWVRATCDGRSGSFNVYPVKCSEEN